MKIILPFYFQDEPSMIATIVKSRVLLRRVCTTPIWWITTTFVYYGLSINSTSLSDTMYLNFILTCAIEIPGYFTAVLLLDRVGRKFTLSGGFFLSAVCNIAFAFIPTGKSYRLLVLEFLINTFLWEGYYPYRGLVLDSSLMLLPPTFSTCSFINSYFAIVIAFKRDWAAVNLYFIYCAFLFRT